MERVYLSSEDIAEALVNAGVELRPEDASTLKFWKIAEELGRKVRQMMRANLEELERNSLWEKK